MVLFQASKMFLDIDEMCIL